VVLKAFADRTRDWADIESVLSRQRKRRAGQARELSGHARNGPPLQRTLLSISHGIAWGFVSYCLLKLVRGRWREIHPLVAVFAVLLVVFLAAA